MVNQAKENIGNEVKKTVQMNLCTNALKFLIFINMKCFNFTAGKEEFIPTLPAESTRNLSVPPAASTAKDALPAVLSASTIKKSVPAPVTKVLK